MGRDIYYETPVEDGQGHIRVSRLLFHLSTITKKSIRIANCIGCIGHSLLSLFLFVSRHACICIFLHHTTLDSMANRGVTTAFIPFYFYFYT